MNNRAMVLDVESTGISDDAQATELGWCDVHFDENGQLQPWGKAFVQRCKPEIPISFGSMAVSHIYEDELINEPSHRDVINHVVNDSVTYVIGHNIDYDMKVIANAGQNRQYKRICSLAIAQACYPFDTDYKLLAMCHMLDYDFARKHAKNAHNAKFDVMFCVRILRIMCMNNNITNMEQLYQFSEFCRIPQYMRFGKHKGMAVDDVPLSYKRYLLDKGVEEILMLKSLLSVLLLKILLILLRAIVLRRSKSVWPLNKNRLRMSFKTINSQSFYLKTLHRLTLMKS